MKYEEYQVRVFENHMQWFQNGVLHRVGGPAKEYLNGSKVWFKNGELHREDGPAIEYANGYKIWCLEGQKYTEEEFVAKTSLVMKAYDNCIVKIDGVQYRLEEVK